MAPTAVESSAQVPQLPSKAATAPQGNYVRWDQKGVEYGMGAEEDHVMNEVAKQINTAQQAVLDAHHHAFSGTHVKSHGVVKGSMEILPNLPAHLAQSMFAKPGRYDMAMRFSTETTDLVPDTLPQPRGVGIKVFGVEGKKLRPDGKDPKTQDLEFNSFPNIELGTAEICRDIIGLRLEYGACPAKLTEQLKKRDDFEIQDARNRAPNRHLLGIRQYSQTAFRYGDYIAKFALVPDPDGANYAMRDDLIKEDDSPLFAFRHRLDNFLEKNAADFLLQVQLCQDLEAQPVEDARYEWDQKRFPYETVAKVHIPPQDANVPRRIAFWRDEMRVDPWHGLETLRPLGSLNRTRRIVYKASAAFRRKANGGIKEVTVDSIDQIPDQ